MSVKCQKCGQPLSFPEKLCFTCDARQLSTRRERSNAIKLRSSQETEAVLQVSKAPDVSKCLTTAATKTAETTTAVGYTAAEVDKKWCTACGEKLQVTALYCTKCGARQLYGDLDQELGLLSKRRQDTDVLESRSRYVYNEKSKSTAGLLALSFGGFGVHKFYLKQHKAGVIYLVCSTLGCVLILPPLIILILAIIDGIRLLSMTDTEFDRLCDVK
jgi:TM2 domain-containing membrane protein YozV